jgi:DNA polymerase-3 subunit delta'
MNFNQIIGQDFLKDYFKKAIAQNRIAHTQLFVGDEGTGSLAMAWAFAGELLCNNDPNCMRTVQHLSHPDLHFVFPTATTDRIKKPDSSQFMTEWRSFLTQNPYAGLFDWMKHLEVANKQGLIRVVDAENLIKKVAVKPYTAKYKVFIIWMIEKMNNETANKLLKILEEPPEDTKFILIAEKTDMILPTILSRCQVHHFNPISVAQTTAELTKNHHISEEKALKIAHQSNGNWHKALQLAAEDNNDEDFQKAFITWVRVAFSAKSNKQAIQKLIKWSEEMAATGRESQKQFLQFALETFRQALLINYQNKQLAYYDFSKLGFDIQKLAPFIHSSNIEAIYKTIADATYHIERNANPKLIFLDLSIGLTKLIHQKEKAID